MFNLLQVIFVGVSVIKTSISEIVCCMTRSQRFVSALSAHEIFLFICVLALLCLISDNHIGLSYFHILISVILKIISHHNFSYFLKHKLGLHLFFNLSLACPLPVVLSALICTIYSRSFIIYRCLRTYFRLKRICLFDILGIFLVYSTTCLRQSQ